MSVAYRSPAERQAHTGEHPQCRILERGEGVGLDVDAPISERPNAYSYLARLEITGLQWGRDEALDNPIGENAVYRLLWLDVSGVERDVSDGYILNSDSLLHPDDEQVGRSPQEIAMDNPLVVVGEELFGWDEHGRRTTKRGIVGIPQDGERYGFGPGYNAHQLDYPEGAQRLLFTISFDPEANIIRLVNAGCDALQVHCHAVPARDISEE